MKRILCILIWLFFSINIFAQDSYVSRILSFEDSVLLNNFWTNFKIAINNNDKEKLATLCKFPFYCSPCIDDTTLKNNNHITIKITKKVFNSSRYLQHYLFDDKVRAEINKQNHFETYFFYPTFDDKDKIVGYNFSFTMVAPSKKWEGLQGFIYLNKINGQYKITGIDTVP